MVFSCGAPSHQLLKRYTATHVAANKKRSLFMRALNRATGYCRSVPRAQETTMRPEASIPVKTNADLTAAVGPTMATTVKGLRNGHMRRLPSSVCFYRSKPQFHLDDGSTLHAYAVDLAGGTVEGRKYCGSADTTINNAAAQLSERGAPPANTALLFVESYWNGKNHSWTLHIVTENFARALEAK